MFKIILIICCSSFLVMKCEAFWNLQQLPDFFQKFVIFSSKDQLEQKSDNTKELKEVCDENELILQLARLYVTSPERIILLLSMNSTSTTCQNVADVLHNINVTVSESIPLPSDNLYMKLYNGLDYFNSYICIYNTNPKSQHLNNYHGCLTELREDLLDCEGPPDWFEKSQEAVVCQYYNDIINCNYIKAALLCGLKPALMLRIFSQEIIKKVVKFKCKISRSLPYIDDPMPALACPLKYYLNFFLPTYFLALINVCVL